jgi:hypothetical protein
MRKQERALGEDVDSCAGLPMGILSGPSGDYSDRMMPAVLDKLGAGTRREAARVSPQVGVLGPGGGDGDVDGASLYIVVERHWRELRSAVGFDRRPRGPAAIRAWRSAWVTGVMTSGEARGGAEPLGRIAKLLASLWHSGPI